MKIVIKILSFCALISVLSGCFDDPGTDITLTKRFISFSVNSQQLSESDGDGELLIEISESQTSDVQISFTLETDNAINGVDFMLNATSVTIPAGEFSATIPFTVTGDEVFQDVNRSFTLTIGDISPSGIEIDGYSSVTVEILDDDCLFDVNSWAGTYDAIEDYGTSTYGPYDLTLVQDPVDPNTFHMDNFYDSGLDAYIVFDGETSTVRFPDQEPAAGVPITNSSGTFAQCDGEIVINLNFDGGDWVFRLTKQ